MHLRAEGWKGSGPPLPLLRSSSSHGLLSVSSPGLSFGLLTSLMCRVVAVVVMLTMVFVPTEQLIGFNGGKWFSFPTELSVLLFFFFYFFLSPCQSFFLLFSSSFFLSFFLLFLSILSFLRSFCPSFILSFVPSFCPFLLLLVHFVGL